MKTTNWHSGPSLGGDGLTSRLTGRPFAATDTCVGVIRACTECGGKYYATAKMPDHWNPITRIYHAQSPTLRGHAPTVVTGG